MYIKTSLFRKKLKTPALRFFDRLDGNNNLKFSENGEEFFVENLIKSLKCKSKKLIAFDIGANVGDYTQILLDRSRENNIFFEIHTFEPTKKCFETLSKRFANENNVIANKFGISDSKSNAKIFYDKEQSGLASLYQRNLDFYNKSLNISETISLVRLDDYFKEKNISHINFIKTDVEGHELNIFRGMGKYLNSDFIDFIQFEYGGANLDSHVSLMDMYSFFEERDFKIAKIMPKGLEIRKYDPSMDNFMYSNYVAISSKVLYRC